MADEILCRIDEDGSVGLYDPYAVIECETKEDYEDMVALLDLGASIVRCKDCKHYEVHKPNITENCERNGRLVPMLPDDFCSYGERREENADG